MTLDQIDKELDRALKRVHLKIEYAHIVWLLENLEFPKSKYEPNMGYLPFLGPDLIDLAREDYKMRLDFIRGEAMRAGLYLDHNKPLINLPAL